MTLTLNRFGATVDGPDDTAAPPPGVVIDGTEGASVQTLNLPGADRPGSAGRPTDLASPRRYRGRPRNVYRVTAEGLHALGENYRQLAVVLWEAITGFEDEAVRMRLPTSVRIGIFCKFGSFDESRPVCAPVRL